MTESSQSRSTSPPPAFAQREDYVLFGMLTARGLLDPGCSAELAAEQDIHQPPRALIDVLTARCGLNGEEVDALRALLGEAPPTRLPRTLVTALRQLDAELSSETSTKPNHAAVGSAQTPRPTSPLTTSETTRLDLARAKGGMVGIEAAGHFVLDRIGSGGQGEVYLAKQLSLDRYVALKLLDIPARSDRERFIAAFRKEAKILARINHARIVKVHEIFITEDEAFFTMEYVNGRTLAELVSKASGPLPVEVVANLACQACSALARTERDGLAHRDIKPANILVDENGDLKIIDFGLAAASETISGNFVGTPQFASPEQAARLPATPASDQYSLGISLYFAATGRLPFAAKHSREWIEHHVNTAPPRASSFNEQLPSAVDEVLQRMLAKDPAARFPNFDECFRAWDRISSRGSRQGSASSPHFLGEELVTLGRKERQVLARNTVLLLGFWALLAAAAILGEHAANTSELAHVVAYAGAAGATLLATSLACIGYIASTRKKWLPLHGSPRAWLAAHVATAITGCLLLMFYFGTFLRGALPGGEPTPSLLQALTASALVATALSGSFGFLILRTLQRRLSMDGLQLRGARAGARSQAFARLSMIAISRWRYAHLTFAICFVVLALVLVLMPN